MGAIFDVRLLTDDEDLVNGVLATQGLTITNVTVTSPSTTLNAYATAAADDLAVRVPDPVVDLILA